MNSRFSLTWVFLGSSARGFFIFLKACPASVCLVVWLCDPLNRAFAPVFSGLFPVLAYRCPLLVEITTISLPSLVFSFLSHQPRKSLVQQVDLDAPLVKDTWMLGWP